MTDDVGGVSAMGDLSDQAPDRLIAECAKYLKDGETPAQRIERERRDTDAVLTLLIREKERTKALEELLMSAHCIALRQGADTAWDTFAASIRALGIGAVTARVYKMPRDEHGHKHHEAGHLTPEFTGDPQLYRGASCGMTGYAAAQPEPTFNQGENHELEIPQEARCYRSLPDDRRATRQQR